MCHYRLVVTYGCGFLFAVGLCQIKNDVSTALLSLKCIRLIAEKKSDLFLKAVVHQVLQSAVSKFERTFLTWGEKFLFEL